MSKQSKQQGTAEALLHTENDHWNEYALRFLVKVKEGNLFTTEDQAMSIYQDVVETLAEHHAEPLKGDRSAEKLLEKYTEAQRLAVYQGAYSYLQDTEYGTAEQPIDFGPLLAILKVRTKEPDVPRWRDTARSSLQALLRKELEALPATLAQLEPKDRVAAVTRLIGYVLPKEENRTPTTTTW